MVNEQLGFGPAITGSVLIKTIPTLVPQNQHMCFKLVSIYYCSKPYPHLSSESEPL